jgi:FdhE protein
MDQSLQKLHQFRDQRPSYKEIVDLAERLISEKRRMKKKKSSPAPKADPAKAKAHMEAGFPYSRPEEVFPPSSAADESFSLLLKALKEASPARYEELKKYMDRKGFRLEEEVERLLQNQLSEGPTEGESGPEGSLLFFFLVQLLKPSFEAQAELWRAGLKEISWSQGYCPFCGAFAGMAEIREEGRRFLHCSLCGTEWEYPRTQCPYCRNEDQEQLTYFQVEGEEGYRVDICLSCRHYWKTVDFREMGGPLDFEVEDYLTLHLDHLAQEEGYIRPAKLFIDFK